MDKPNESRYGGFHQYRPDVSQQHPRAGSMILIQVKELPMDNQQIKKILIHSRFFESLDPEDIDKVCPLCRARSYQNGEYLFQQGDFGEHLYVIAEGQAYLERTVDLDTRRGRVTIDTLGKGRLLGCWSTLLGEPHTLMSSAVCAKPSQVLAIRGPDLRNLMLSDERLGFRLMEKFCYLLRERIQAAYGAMEKI
jgi:CRP-like cAMP-binding protein